MWKSWPERTRASQTPLLTRYIVPGRLLVQKDLGSALRCKLLAWARTVPALHHGEPGSRVAAEVSLRVRRRSPGRIQSPPQELCHEVLELPAVVNGPELQLPHQSVR